MLYRSASRIQPDQVRQAHFDARRRGLDPNQVYDYLRRVADEIERLHRELTTAETATQRIRQGLRHWQARHINCRATDTADHADHRSNQPTGNDDHRNSTRTTGDGDNHPRQPTGHGNDHHPNQPAGNGDDHRINGRSVKRIRRHGINGGHW